jgi:hypothetical protein
VFESRDDFWSTSSNPVSASDATIGSSFGLVSEKLLPFDLSTIKSALIELKIWRMREFITDQLQGSFSFWNFAVFCVREKEVSFATHQTIFCDMHDSHVVVL